MGSMNRTVRPALALAGLALLFSGVPAESQDSGIKWHTDKARAFNEARRTGKPLWILFR